MRMADGWAVLFKGLDYTGAQRRTLPAALVELWWRSPTERYGLDHSVVIICSGMRPSCAAVSENELSTLPKMRVQAASP